MFPKGEYNPNWNGGQVILICKTCNKPFKVKPYEKNISKYCSPHCAQWKGGKTTTKAGYILIWKPEHPCAYNNGYIKEHRYVMEQYIGRYLLSSEPVHHINHIKSDNRIENLKLTTQKEHMAKYHRNELLKIGYKTRFQKNHPPLRTKSSGKMIPCKNCKKETYFVPSRIKQYLNHFCGSICANKFNAYRRNYGSV